MVRVMLRYVVVVEARVLIRDVGVPFVIQVGWHAECFYLFVCPGVVELGLVLLV